MKMEIYWNGLCICFSKMMVHTWVINHLLSHFYIRKIHSYMSNPCFVYMAYKPLRGMHKVEMGLVGNMRYIGIFTCNDLVNFLIIDICGFGVGKMEDEAENSTQTLFCRLDHQLACIINTGII